MELNLKRKNIFVPPQIYHNFEEIVVRIYLFGQRSIGFRKLKIMGINTLEVLMNAVS